MSAKFKIPSFAVACLLFLLTVILSSPAYAQADTCQTTDQNGAPVSGAVPPAAASCNNCPGGFNDPGGGGTAQNTFQNSLQSAVSNRINAKHQYIANSSVISNVQYCFNNIANIFNNIASSGLSLQTIAINFVITKIVDNLINTLCAMVMQTINQVIATSLGIINSLLCLPLPKLQMPSLSFHIPNFGSSCNGLQLGKVSLTPPGATSQTPPNALVWTLWKGKLNLNTQQ